MSEAGAIIFAQDEDSCVVFGFPKETIGMNCFDRILPLCAIAAAAIAALND
jgi:chemotaxis response regulator CheB